ncbi:MAG: SDR family oxidoreductase [Eggerthellaceae bacterium]|nr:SDR family oxidoreductase [Eggerthellaceae bacterium]
MNAEKGRVIVVTGAAKPDGIGAKTCQTFIDKEPNCHLVVLDILDDRVVEWAEGYPNVTYLHTDVASKESVIAAKDYIMEHFGAIDVLVCGSAYQGAGSLPLAELSEESWKACIDVNLTGTFFCCQVLGGCMLDRGGVIVNIASMGGVNPIFISGSYSPSKAGVIMLSKQLAGEWGPRGVRVNVVAPGHTYTDINRERIDKPGAREKRNAMTPLGRVGVPADQANAIYFLASPEADYITGSVLLVDGGMTINTLAPLMTAF